ncbi:MAG: hypothetical protein LBU25_10390 [Treponema sp.]|jgi:hypothetical protein|nr:hypothetical protein [Treponema sp.]
MGMYKIRKRRNPPLVELCFMEGPVFFHALLRMKSEGNDHAHRDAAYGQTVMVVVKVAARGRRGEIHLQADMEFRVFPCLGNELRPYAKAVIRKFTRIPLIGCGEKVRDFRVNAE